MHYADPVSLYISRSRMTKTGCGGLCGGTDTRFSDSRTPTGHESTHITGGSDIIPAFTSTASGLGIADPRFRVDDGVLDVPMSEVILNEPSIRALIGQGEAASVAQHAGMDEQWQGSVRRCIFAKAS